MSYLDWPNRSTWAAYLWLTADELLYQAAVYVASLGDEEEATDNIRLWISDALWPQWERTDHGRRVRDDIGVLEDVDFVELTRAFRREL